MSVVSPDKQKPIKEKQLNEQLFLPFQWCVDCEITGTLLAAKFLEGAILLAHTVKQITRKAVTTLSRQSPENVWPDIKPRSSFTNNIAKTLRFFTLSCLQFLVIAMVHPNIEDAVGVNLSRSAKLPAPDDYGMVYAH